MLFTRNSIKTISPAEAAEGARAGRLTLVDVRGAGERLEGHPSGSRHVPVAQVSRRLDELPADRPVAFICRSGRRSAMAAKAAARAGLDARNVEGGMIAWERAGLQTRR